MHWANDLLYYTIHDTNKQPLVSLQKQFCFNSPLDTVTKGVMDVMFAASCFQLPIVIELGQLFWMFARELIRLRVSTVDHLNFLLWGVVLPQTVLVLDPVTFTLDSLIPPIKTQITIQGRVETQTSDDEVFETSTRTILLVPSNSSLIFLSDVRLCTLTVKQVENPAYRQSECVLQFLGFGPRALNLYMNGVELVNAGCSVVNYDKVHCNHLSVTDAVVGFLGTNIKDLYLTGTHTHLLETEVKTGFYFCDTALSLRDISTFVCAKHTIFNCHVVFDAKISKVCVVEDSAIYECTHMGELLTCSNCVPSFVSCKVIMRVPLPFVSVS